MKSRQSASLISRSMLESISRIRAALDSRREARVRTQAEVKIRSFTSATANLHAGLLVDVSRSGLRLKTSIRYPKGSQIEVTLDAFLMRAAVRYCREVEICTYGVGAQVEQVIELPGEPAPGVGDASELGSPTFLD